MGGSKLRKAIGAVKDRTSIGLAKVGSKASLSSLDVAIVKATRHEEYPPDERRIHEVITLTSYSRAHVNACVEKIAKRLNKTKNWVVALKTLVLVQRLLSEGDRGYEQEVFFATRRGTRLLNMSDFRDASRTVDAWDYSAFVRTYALYLDDQLEFRMQGRNRWRRGGGGGGREEEEEGGGGGGGGALSCKVAAAAEKVTPVREMSVDGVNNRAHHLMQILERFLACRPTGAAKLNRVVAAALYPIVKESFQLHSDMSEILGTLTDRFMQLDPPEMAKVYEIFCRVSKQHDELNSFYCWCKSVGIGRFSEYPEVQKIPEKKLDAMDDFIHQKAAMSHKRKDQKPVEPPTNPKPPPVKESVNSNKEGDDAKEVIIKTDAVKEESNCRSKREGTGDLLNFGEDDREENKLALALFEPSHQQEPESKPWEPFKDHSSSPREWEAALLRSVGHSPNPNPSYELASNGPYQHGGSMMARRQQTAGYGGNNNSDPFYASLAVAPAPYVQMSEMEKHRLRFAQEQLAWQQHDQNINRKDNNFGGFTRMQ